MTKYLLPILLVFFWSCEADEEVCDNTISDEAKQYADDNWNLQSLWNFTQSGPSVIENNGLYFTDNKLKAMRSYMGVEHLTLQLSGDLLSLFESEFFTSDSLHLFASYLTSPDISVVKDSKFYLNIGKYDQFVGGWSDVFTEWYWEEIPDDDSTETVVKTPFKQEYLDMLPDCE